MYDNAKVNILKNKKWYGTGLALVVLLIAFFTAYQMDYRFKSNLTIGKQGKLSMVIPSANTNIFIDQSKKITTTKENEEVNLSFSPTNHSVIISREGYFPWKKDFVIQSSKTLNLYPIFVSQNASGQVITKQDPEYWKIRNSIISFPLPSEESPVFSSDKSVFVWIDDNAIMVKVGEEILNVVQPDTIIRNVAFYKDRSDVIMFSTSGSVFVIEIDKNGQQNFMPVYSGQKPSFLKTDPNFIYVLDGEALMQVVI